MVTTGQLKNILVTSERSPILFSYPSVPLFPLALALDVSYKWSNVLSFGVWLLPAHRLFPRFIHAVASIIPFQGRAAFCWTDRPHGGDVSVRADTWPVSTPWLSWTTLLWTLVDKTLWGNTLWFLSHRYLEIESLSQMVILCLVFWGAVRLFSKAAEPFCFPTGSMWQIPFLHNPTYICHLPFWLQSFWWFWSGNFVVVFICIFLVPSGVGHLLMCLWAICGSSSKVISSDVWFAGIFSYSAVYCFTFSMASFEAQTFLILTTSSVSIFLLLVLRYGVWESTEKCRSTKIHPCVLFQGVLEFQLLHVGPWPFPSSSCLGCEVGIQLHSFTSGQPIVPAPFVEKVMLSLQSVCLFVCHTR